MDTTLRTTYVYSGIVNLANIFNNHKRNASHATQSVHNAYNQHKSVAQNVEMIDG